MPIGSSGSGAGRAGHGYHYQASSLISPMSLSFGETGSDVHRITLRKAIQSPHSPIRIFRTGARDGRPASLCEVSTDELAVAGADLLVKSRVPTHRMRDMKADWRSDPCDPAVSDYERDWQPVVPPRHAEEERPVLNTVQDSPIHKEIVKS